MINDINQLNPYLIDNNFKILHLNICSINKNFDNLLCFLQELSNSLDIIILTETHKINDSQLFQLTGYSMVYNQGIFNKCDGVVVYVKEYLQMEYTLKNIGDIKCIELNIGKGSNRFLLTCLYKSPAIDGNIFVDTFSEYLQQIKNYKNHIMAGDINLDLLRTDKKCTEDYKSILASYGYLSYNKFYTRPQSKTCLDHFFVKSFGANNLVDTQSFTINYKITDHCPILLCFKNKNYEQNLNYSETRCKKYINYNNLRHDLTNQTWNEIYLVNDLNISTNNFVTKLQTLITKHTVTIKQSNTKDGKNSWITKTILKDIKIKNEQYKQHLQNPQNITIKNKYIRTKSDLEKAIKRSKKIYAEKLIKNNTTNTRDIWTSVNSICNKTKQKTKIEKIQLANSQEITNEFEIANHFNDFFIEIGENLAKQINTPPGYMENVEREPKGLYFFKETTNNEIQQIVKELKTKKAPGYDGIKSETLKEISNEIAPIISYLINFSFQIGSFPNCLKLGEVKPLHKQGPKQNLNNYRPISLISNIAKIFEKVVKLRMVTFLERNKIISDKQFGFRENKSTEDAILKLTSDIYEAIDNKKASLCVYIDLTKAFDTVSHKILECKLEQCGFRGSVLNLLKSYLNNRKQYVNLNGVKSNLRTVTCGVPQGTVLGPILFTIYINNLLKLQVEGKIGSFCDDTVSFYSANNWEELKHTVERDLNKIYPWFQFNKLTLNQSKTTFLPFTSYKTNLPDYETIKIDQNFIISRAKHVRYLGVIMDGHLRWDKHIQHLISKTRFLVTRFAHLRDYLEVDYLRKVYFALFQSHINYGLVGWGGARDNCLRDLENLQKWVLKIIYRKGRSFPTDQLYIESKIFDPKQLYFQKLLMCINRKKININVVRHQHHTRNRENELVLVPASNKEIGHRSFKFLAPKFYNYLPKDLRDVIFRKKFKKLLKNWIIQRGRLEIHELFRIIA